MHENSIRQQVNKACGLHTFEILNMNYLQNITH
jgi:hypothetical protein